jgi:hypothetical protein
MLGREKPVVVVLACGTAAFAASLRFVRRVLELRNERSIREQTLDVAAHFERIEQTVEATAIEVERIAEANRFLAKLLTERSGAIGTIGKSPERVITPH